MPLSSTSRCALTRKSAEPKKFVRSVRNALRAAVANRAPVRVSFQKRPRNEISKRKTSGRSEAILPAQESLQVLRRENRRHQLQRREVAFAIRSGTSEDHA